MFNIKCSICEINSNNLDNQSVWTEIKLTIVGLIWPIKIRAGFHFKCGTVCPKVLQNQIPAETVACAMTYEIKGNNKTRRTLP